MKTKSFFVAALLSLTALNATAGDDDKNLFNHLSVGVTIGTPGVGIDLGMPIGDYVQVRAGFTAMPTIKVKTDLDVNAPQVEGFSIPAAVEIEGKSNIMNGSLLFDVFPFKTSAFHITAGAYVGKSNVVKAYNTHSGEMKDLYEWNKANPDKQYGAELGDYLLTPNAQGNFDALIKTASFKPYLGIGFGRAVPKTKRIGVSFDIGCQFWGSPKVFCNDTELKKENVSGDAGSVIKTISKVSVYPVLNFRLCGRIF